MDHIDDQDSALPKSVLAGLPGVLPMIEAAYKDVHAHPELSMQETRTAAIAAKHLSENNFEVTTGVGKTGVVGVMRNGDGPVVMMRADMDALPIKENGGCVCEQSHSGRSIR